MNERRRGRPPERPRRAAGAPARGARTSGARPSGSGGEQVEGRHAVLALLRAGTRAVHAVYVTSEAGTRDAGTREAGDDDSIDEIVELAGNRVRMVPADRLLAMARSAAPQGVVATCAPLPDADLVTLLRAPAPFLVALDGVTDPGNLGAVIRTADSAGATGVIVPRHRSAAITPTVAKAAAGAVEYVPICSVGGVAQALDRARREKVWTVGLDGEGAQSLEELQLATEPLVVVLGAEGRGLSRLVRERCDVVVSIPMYGHVESLNVSAAAAIVLHEVARRRHRNDG